MTAQPKPRHRVEFASRLRTIREAKGLSQERLAEMTGVHRNHIGVIERSEKAPSLDTIVAMADALGVDPVEFFQPASERRELDQT